MSEDTDEIVKEFLRLNEKSKDKFVQIGNLPRSGYKKWQPYFERAFTTFTELWRFQQQHREVLSDNQVLRRHHIGEIASKIGQLYYQYYLRTSNTSYLTETFCFYFAIRCRGYYNTAKSEKRPDFMVKKLRYCCRFILVCLVMENVQLASELLQDLSKDIADYDSAYQPLDASWWAKVAEEVRCVLRAVQPVAVTDGGKPQLQLKHRLSADTCPPLSAFPLTQHQLAAPLRLTDAIIVGSCGEQAKFSELSVDMLRMSLTLEREPDKDDTVDRRKLPELQRNPRKCLLYKPTLPEIVFSVNSCFCDLPADGAILLYFSADARRCAVRRKDDCGYKEGGLAVHKMQEAADQTKAEKKASKESKCLYPGDLFCFTRKPLFLIVDSDNSCAFKKMPNLFGEPLVCLMSPEQLPGSVSPGGRQQGSLFTLFLHCPLSAMAVVCGAASLPLPDWERGLIVIDSFLLEAGKVLLQSKETDAAYRQFCRDDFLRTVTLRFLFCCLVLRLHRDCKSPKCYPTCSPALPHDLLDRLSLHSKVRELAALFDSADLFCEPEDYSRE